MAITNMDQLVTTTTAYLQAKSKQVTFLLNIQKTKQNKRQNEKQNEKQNKNTV